MVNIKKTKKNINKTHKKSSKKNKKDNSKYVKKNKLKIKSQKKNIKKNQNKIKNQSLTQKKKVKKNQNKIKKKQLQTQKKNINKKEECIDITKIPELKNNDVDYLKNSICKFIPLYNFNKNVKKNVVSCCFFKMRKGGYKDFSRYLNGITVVAKHIKLELGDSFVLKLFIDYSIYKDKEIMDYLNKIDNVEMVLYSCYSYCVGEHHLGTFGTFIRMFPCFDLPNNDTNNVIVSDIDYFDKPNNFLFTHYTSLLKLYNIKQLNTVELAIKGRPQHSFQDNRRKYIINGVMYPYVIFDRIITFKKINFKSLEIYLTKVKTEKRHITPYYISPAVREKKCDEFVCFGIDEEYLNSILMPLLIRQKKSILINMVINKLSPFYFIDRQLKYNKDFKIIVKNLVNGIMPNIEKSSSNDIYNYLIDIFYDKKTGRSLATNKYTKNHKELIKRLDDLYSKMLKNKNTLLANLDALKIFNKLSKGYLRLNYIKGYNNNLKLKILYNPED
jgi:hypothetical protein